MAASLVKDDPDRTETAKVWAELRHWLDDAHPDAVLLSEWGEPEVSVPAGFHADFFLQFGGPSDGLALRSLWSNGEGTVNESWDPLDCFFDRSGQGSPRPFLEAWEKASTALGASGFISLPTANHDFSRLNCGPRTPEQLPAAFAFQLTWPTLPAIYYGDEIGMRYVPGLPDHEGSVLGPRYNRAGCRTPMQWEPGPGAGFSTASAERYYLPLDPAADRPDVAGQRADEHSLLHTVRRLIALRRAVPELGTRGSVEVLHDGYPLVHLRGGRYLVTVNPGREEASVALAAADGSTAAALRAGRARLLEGDGVELGPASVTAAGFGWAVHDLGGPDPVS
jgi:maltose alpha-D-glucosyltransferase/alpha-amylase